MGRYHKNHVELSLFQITPPGGTEENFAIQHADIAMTGEEFALFLGPAVQEIYEAGKPLQVRGKYLISGALYNTASKNEFTFYAQLDAEALDRFNETRQAVLEAAK